MSTQSPSLVSVSRRTDIPAFYGEWFRRRLAQGWCETANPFSGQKYRVSLVPEKVLGWIFWSRNYEPFLGVLCDLHARGQRFLCHFTIVGYPRILEPRAPDADRMIDAAHRLAEAFGPEIVQWRYDPILLSSLTPPEWHEQNFARLVEQLKGATQRCLFSFPTMYQKTIRNLEKIAAQSDNGTIHIWSREAGDFALDDLSELAGRLAAVARDNGMEMHSCCEDRWVDPERNIFRAHCADWPLLERLGAGKHIPQSASLSLNVPLQPTRKQCGCYRSVDIGRYQTCAHGCAYCYAVDDPSRAQDNLAAHNFTSPGL